MGKDGNLKATGQRLKWWVLTGTAFLATVLAIALIKTVRPKQRPLGSKYDTLCTHVGDAYIYSFPLTRDLEFFYALMPPVGEVLSASQSGAPDDVVYESGEWSVRIKGSSDGSYGLMEVRAASKEEGQETGDGASAVLYK